MDISQLKAIKENFLSELQNAKTHKPSSLSYLKHEILSGSLVSDGEIFQVLVVGGTLFRKALVRKDGEKITIIDKEEKNQPPFKNPHDFYLFLEKELSREVRVVALNFAYPLRPIFEHGRLDGILLTGMKENSFQEVLGKAVGYTIEKHFYRIRKQRLIVSVANDTICLLLSGLSRFAWNQIACAVVGSGVNVAIFENEKTLINVESGNFDKFEQSLEGEVIDMDSQNPSHAVFEKETSGIYLYKHFNIIREVKDFVYERIHSTQELDQIAQIHIEGASETARNLLKRSAALIAAQFAAILEFQKRDLTFVIEGSLFWYSDGYKNNVKKYVERLTTYKARFVKIENSTIIGAARLVI